MLLLRVGIAQAVGRGGGVSQGSAKQKTDSHRLQSLIKRLESSSQHPVVVFCFSRKRCESFPTAMPKLELLSQEDKSKVHIFVRVRRFVREHSLSNFLNRPCTIVG